MKWKIIALLVCLPCMAFAQTYSTKRTCKRNKVTAEFGLKAGIVLNKLHSNLSAYTSNDYIGFKGGIFTRIFINNWYIQPEVNFVMNGGTLFDNNSSSQIKLRTNNIEFPLLGGYDINLTILHLRLNAGPYVTYSLTETVESNRQITGPDIRDVNAGIMAGAGIDIWKLGFDFRYQFGLTNMLKTQKTLQNPFESIRNGAFEFALSFRF